MYGAMLRKADLMAECLIAKLTGKRTLAGMRTTDMYFKSVRSAEHFVAFETGKDERFTGLCFAFGSITA